MTPEDTAWLFRYIMAACPSQRFDEYTPDVWHEIFPPWLTLDDARAAVVAIKRRQKFVDPSDIVAEVSRVRADRLDRGIIDAPPAELAGDPARSREYQAALIRNREAIASGETTGRPALQAVDRKADLDELISSARARLAIDGKPA